MALEKDLLSILPLGRFCKENCLTSESFSYNWDNNSQINLDIQTRNCRQHCSAYKLYAFSRKKKLLKVTKYDF